MKNNLVQVFKKNNIKYQDFTQATGISRSRLHTYFNKSLKDFKRHEVAMLCSLLPITPDFFGLDDSIYTFKYKDKSDSAISYSHLKKNDLIKNYQDFLELYFDRIIDEVKKAKEEIIVLDYTGDNLFVTEKLTRSGSDFKSFHDNYERYLEAISEFIYSKKKENLAKPVYTRILQCPINKLDRGINFNNHLDVVLDLSYNDMFAQFEQLYRDDCKDYFNLYSIEKAFRPYSVMIIDRKIIITEYVRYNKSLEAVPDILFIDYKRSDSANDVAKVLIDTHMTSIEKVLADDSKLVYRERAKRRLKIIENEYLKAKENIEPEIKDKTKRLGKLSIDRESEPLEKEIGELKKNRRFLKSRRKLTRRKLNNILYTDHKLKKQV
ncbi:helix-turn-helix domain-containing protein [Seonamhaeicola sp.]|uniref:helix-turn-helix domain-containing protein n=1 Tax=Seonamhaeicola sp. TaxID=1912245 RepID=UPI002610D68F|nr:helix-turn-helix domain-containing protein [Seonamhaeicola sp.]